MAFDSIEHRIDRRWVPTSQSFETARKDILTVVRHIAGDRKNIKDTVREYWLESSACTIAYGIALELFHVLNDLNYARATTLYKALKLHADTNKGAGPDELFKFAAPEKAAALIHSKGCKDYARTYATLEFGFDLTRTIDAVTARTVLSRFKAIWIVNPDATYHIHLIREGIWLDIVLPGPVVDELRADPALALAIREAERDARGFEQ